MAFNPAHNAGFQPTFNPGFAAFEELFGPGGFAGAAGDPLMEQLFASGAFFGGAQMPQQQQTEPPRQTGPPPTSASAIRSLPRIKVTAYDIAANESAECSICLDEFVIGEPAVRLPCGHLFHEDCVLDWLKKSNECPVCRFELPTDDAEYERGRKQRMAGRKLRMRHTDLTVKSAQELTRLAKYIDVDVRGCLEKSELVEKIAASPQVQIIPADTAEPGGASPEHAASPGRPPVFSQAQLDAMSIGEVKALMQRLNVDFSDLTEKADMVLRLVSLRKIIVSGESPAAGGTSAAAAASPGRPQAPSRPSSSGDVVMGSTEDTPTPPASGGGAAQPAGDSGGGDISKKSVGELRQLAKRLGVSLDGCLEKGELVQRIASSSAFQQSSGG